MQAAWGTESRGEREWLYPPDRLKCLLSPARLSVCLCVCKSLSVCMSGLPSAQRYPDCRSVPVDQAKSLTLPAHFLSLIFLLSFSLCIYLSHSHASSCTTLSLFCFTPTFNILFMRVAIYLCVWLFAYLCSCFIYTRTSLSIVHSTWWTLLPHTLVCNLLLVI